MLKILCITELQVRTTMIYYYTSIKMAQHKNTDNTKHWQGMQQQELSLTASRNAK